MERIDNTPGALQLLLRILDPGSWVSVHNVRKHVAIPAEPSSGVGGCMKESAEAWTILRATGAWNIDFRLRSPPRTSRRGEDAELSSVPPSGFLHDRQDVDDPRGEALQVPTFTTYVHRRSAPSPGADEQPPPSMLYALPVLADIPCMSQLKDAALQGGSAGG